VTFLSSNPYILSEGEAPLLGWMDPDEAREWVRKNKQREYTSKLMSPSEAVRKFIKDGSYVAFGGFGHVRVSMVIVHEIVRQNIKNLIYAAKTAVHDIDVLIAAGCVSRVEVAYAFGHELRGLSPAGRRAVEKGEVEVVSEWSNAAFEWRFKAAAMGLPFIPARVIAGTDTFKKSSSKIIRDPFSNKPIVLIPACYPDVAVIHVHKADIYGNAQILGHTIMDFELARAAKRLIITTEEIVHTEELRRQPYQTTIPFFLVDAVVEQPFGSHPGNMPYIYAFDEEHFAEYLSLTMTKEGALQYLQKYIYGVEDFWEYLERIGGYRKLKYLMDLEKKRAEPIYPWVE